MKGSLPIVRFCARLVVTSEACSKQSSWSAQQVGSGSEFTSYV